MAYHRYLRRPSREKLLAFFRVEELPDPNNIRDIRDFVTEWFVTVRKVPVGNINCGYCFIWAYLVWALATPRTVTFVSDSSHVCIKHGGLHYDCEHAGHVVPKIILRHRYDDIETWFWKMTDVALYWGRNGVRKHVFRRVIKKLSGVPFSGLLRTNKALRGEAVSVSAW